MNGYQRVAAHYDHVQRLVLIEKMLTRIAREGHIPPPPRWLYRQLPVGRDQVNELAVREQRGTGFGSGKVPA